MQIARSLFRTVLFVVALSPAIARADESPIAPGTMEFFPSVAFNRSSFTGPGGAYSGSVTHVNFAAGMGYCFSEAFEVAGSFLAQHKAVAGQGRDGFGGATTGLVNFGPQGNVIPFVSGGVGVLAYSTDGESDRSWMFPMLRAGFRTMMFGTRSVNVSLGYHHEINPESNFEESANVFDVGVGISLFRESD
jgi:hypothetical protein